MAWLIQTHPDLRIIETTYSGILTAIDLKSAIKATIDAGELEQIHLFLGNCSSLVGGHSVFDLYDGAKELSASSLRHLFREAILIPANQSVNSNVEFWETVCANRGFNVRLFTDRSDAIGWLLS